jgi:hypothetical protein
MKKILILLFLGLAFMFSNVRVYGEDIRASNPVIEDGKITINYGIYYPKNGGNTIQIGSMAIQFKDGLYDGPDDKLATITIAGRVDEPIDFGIMGNSWGIKIIVISPDGFSSKTGEVPYFLDWKHPHEIKFPERTINTEFVKETFKVKDLLDSDQEGIGTIEFWYLPSGGRYGSIKIKEFKFQYRNGKVRFSKTFEVEQVASAPSAPPSQSSSSVSEPTTPSCPQGYGRGIGDFKCWTVCKSFRSEDFMAIGTFSCKNVELHFSAWNKIDMNWDGQNYQITYDNGWILLGIWGTRLPQEIADLIKFCVENSRYREEYWHELRYPPPPYGKWPKR